MINRVFDSSGPEGKVRGTPQQIIDKYNQLARDAQLSGDRVAAENFQQHAEHYLRLLSAAQREQESKREEQERLNRERQAERDRERARRQERELNGGELVEDVRPPETEAGDGGNDDDGMLVPTPEGQSAAEEPAQPKPGAKSSRRRPSRGKSDRGASGADNPGQDAAAGGGSAPTGATGDRQDTGETAAKSARGRGKGAAGGDSKPREAAE
ncbi:MAG: hypothetical protein Kow0058_02440 [Roseovarius sp.]